MPTFVPALGAWAEAQAYLTSNNRCLANLKIIRARSFFDEDGPGAE